MEKRESDTYLNALKSVKNKEIKFAQPRMKIALAKQGGKCSKCNKTLKNYFAKLVEDPVTKEISFICSECAIKIPKRK